VDTSDRAIYDALVQGDGTDSFQAERVEAMLAKAQRFQLWSREQCLAFVGSRFAAVMGLPDGVADAVVGERLLRRVLFVHITSQRDKYLLLLYVRPIRTSQTSTHIHTHPYTSIHIHTHPHTHTPTHTLSHSFTLSLSLSFSFFRPG
jgi:hypothetical protein